MLQDKLNIFDEKFMLLKDTYDIITSVKPLKKNIEEACEKLKVFLDKGTAVSIDEELRVAFVSVYNILETAIKGLSDESVVALFNS